MYHVIGADAAPVGGAAPDVSAPSMFDAVTEAVEGFDGTSSRGVAASPNRPLRTSGLFWLL
jgi:hypothetical protein